MKNALVIKRSCQPVYDFREDNNFIDTTFARTHMLYIRDNKMYDNNNNNNMRIIMLYIKFRNSCCRVYYVIFC